ncbi:SirA-like protein [Candidatus Magnetoovum chiemensis]|nr:SirA-like protein [Candidatus Magnetoovum chiemensis]
MRIDARGLECPKPILMAEEELSKIVEGIVEVLVDSEASVNNITRFANKQNLNVETFKENDYWRVKIVKGYVCDASSNQAQEQPSQKELFLIVATDTIGKDEALGKILVKGFFDTIRVNKEIPQWMFFVNAGVKLTTENEEIIPILKEIESMGCEIYSCGTCLKYYGIEDKLQVGFRGTTSHVVEGMKDFKKTVWIG